jgi:cyclohexa-1,5-dienecarbonyl-CoA hydratase
MTAIQLDQTERVVWLTLDRPPLNVLDIAMLQELDGVLTDLAGNDEASLVVIGGAGEKAFSAGVDVADHTPEKMPEMIRAFHAALRKLARLPQATVAAIDGVALGGGLELANLCDIAVASSRSRLGYPEIQLACFPPVALVALPTIGGRPAGSDLVLTGELVAAERAMTLGLVSRVFQDEDYVNDLQDLVAGLGKRSPNVLRLTAQQLRSRWLAGFEAALNSVEKVYLSDLAREPDMAEGIAAFLEKREPEWKR